MASLAESSVGSVPMAHITAIQQQLLENRQSAAGARRVPEAETDDGSKDAQPETDTSNKASDDASAVIQESADAYRTPQSSPKAHPPRLSSSRSAPAAEMEAMLQPSPSQQAFKDMTRAESFHGYPGGDTQPMESQIYRDYTESVALKSSRTVETPQKQDKTKLYISPDGKVNTYDTAVTADKTPYTCGEDDTGFIDLANAWQQDEASQGARSTTSDFEELLTSPETQLRVGDGTVTRPTMPETPTLAGHKRSRSGEILSSAPATTKKTPGFSQLFGDGAQQAPVMGATQLFEQTQAPSSPLQDAPRSDPVLTRPSPNINRHLSVSSPVITTSSPINMMYGRLPSSTAGEPRDNYTSMRESQEKRNARIREELGMSVLNEEDEDEDDSQARRIAQRRMQWVQSDQELATWSKVKAPSRPGSRPTSRPSSSRKQNTTVDLITPAPERTRKGVRVEFSISDDEGDTGEDEPMHEDDGELSVNENDQENGSVGGHSENDVYDELGQTVMRSQRDDRADDEHMSIDGSVQQDEDMNDDVRSEHDEAEDAHLLPKTSNAEHTKDAENDGEPVVTATQRSAIAESQSNGQHKAKNAPHRDMQQQSSMSSFVPGSQYAGRTSQDHATMKPKASRSLVASQPEVREKVPSSPPLPHMSDTVPEGTMEASAARREVLAQFQHPRQEDAGAKTLQEIPESDLARPSTSYSNTAYHTAVQGESNSVPIPFSTAQTHLSASGPSPAKSPFKLLVSQHSKSSLESPRKAAGVRRFADIAADPSQPNGSGETDFDVEAIMGEVMTAEDREFIEAVSSPPREQPAKRRKLKHGTSRSASSRSVSPDKVVQPRFAVPSEAASERPRLEEQVPELLQPQPVVADITAVPVQKLDAIQQSSPSKSNELPLSTPENAEPPRTTQESVKKREAAGAAAVSQLLTARSVKSVKVAKLSGKGKKTAAIAVEEEDPKGAARGSKLKIKLGEKKPASTDNMRLTTSVSHEPENAADDVDDGHSEAPAEASVEPTSIVYEQQEATHTEQDVNTTVMTASSRVLALFKGNFNKFYPATWLSSSLDGKYHRVRFDDTTVTNIEAQHVRSLELHIGDQVKVDRPGLRNKACVVSGFGSVARSDEERAYGTDVYGHTTVKIQAKAGRNSLPANGTAPQGEGEVTEVPISEIYITLTMWPSLAERTFTTPETMKRENCRLATPTTGLQTPLSETPDSRSRRATVPSSKVAAKRMSHLREESVASSTSRGDIGLFNGMAFAISYGPSENEKAEVTRLIQRNGGIILETGFDELFELPDLEGGNATSPQKKRAVADGGQSSALRLKAEYADLGFVALIADRHSRRAKYMQALALGLPTLSGRWITDSLNTVTNNADAAPFPWPKYLLAAGESAYLSGAVRSRTIPAYPAADARLSKTIANREILLNDDGVLIVAPRKNKATWEKRKAYAFLTLALGAGSVKRVGDIAEAKALIEDGGKWKWVYVDGPVGQASSTLFGQSDAGGRKRKREEGGEKKVDAKAMSATSRDGTVKVVNDEFVVQSLILGALVN